jgi:hypothetical protein
MPTFTVTVKKVIKLQQTYTITASSEREARRIAREGASEHNADTFATDWRVVDVDTTATTEEGAVDR